MRDSRGKCKRHNEYIGAVAWIFPIFEWFIPFNGKYTFLAEVMVELLVLVKVLVELLVLVKVLVELLVHIYIHSYIYIHLYSNRML